MLKINQIYCGQNSDLIRQIDDSIIDLSIQSPPYGSLRDYQGFSFNYQDLSKELYKITKTGGVCVWVVGDQTIKGGRSGESFRQCLFFQSIGWLIHDIMIYEKNGASFPVRRDGNRYTNIYEWMFIFSKGKPKTANLICDKPNRWAGWTSFGKSKIRTKNGELVERNMKPIPEFSPRNNIWRYNTGKGYSTKDEIAYKHPAIFPEQLAADHIISWSNEGDLVLDCFSGSGTTLKMAKLLKRNYIGIDCCEQYCKDAEKRINKSSLPESIKDSDFKVIPKIQEYLDRIEDYKEK